PLVAAGNGTQAVAHGSKDSTKSAAGPLAAGAMSGVWRCIKPGTSGICELAAGRIDTIGESAARGQTLDITGSASCGASHFAATGTWGVAMASGARCGVTSAMAVGTADATEARAKLLAASAAGAVRKTWQELVDSIVRSMAGKGS